MVCPQLIQEMEVSPTIYVYNSIMFHLLCNMSFAKLPFHTYHPNNGIGIDTSAHSTHKPARAARVRKWGFMYLWCLNGSRDFIECPSHNFNFSGFPLGWWVEKGTLSPTRIILCTLPVAFHAFKFSLIAHLFALWLAGFPLDILHQERKGALLAFNFGWKRPLLIGIDGISQTDPIRKRTQ